MCVSLRNPTPLKRARDTPLHAALARSRHLVAILQQNTESRTFTHATNFNHVPTIFWRPTTANPSIAHPCLDESNCGMWESKIK